MTKIAANQATIHLTASGRVALFVAGDLSTADFVVDVPAGSELDLFVGGNVTVRGAFQVGDASNPARARTYVGGSTVNVGAATTLAGNLYAPRAGITLGGSALTTLYGSMFASSLTASAGLTIHYDEAILTPTSTPACASPASCSTACDCAGQACNSGTAARVSRTRSAAHRWCAARRGRASPECSPPEAPAGSCPHCRWAEAANGPRHPAIRDETAGAAMAHRVLWGTR